MHSPRTDSAVERGWLNPAVHPSRKAAFVTLMALAAGAWLLSLSTGLAAALMEDPPEFLSAMFLSVDEESSFFTWLSASVLLLAGLYALSLAGERFALKARFRWRWLVLALGLLVFSAEEIASVHETVAEGADSFFRPIFPTWKDPTFGWPVVAMALCLPFALAYLPFLAALPRAIRFGAVGAGALYLLGGGVVELVAGWRLAVADFYTWPYVLLSHVEEGLEMAAMLWGFYLLTEMRLQGVSPDA